METNQRFKDADWINTVNSSNVTVGGVGGIGSWLSLYLARVQVRGIFLIDMDDVTLQNLGGQFFANSQIGIKKVRAVYDLLRQFGNDTISISPISAPIESLDFSILPPQNAYFACFDNMEARKVMYEMWKSNLKHKDSIFIDGRMLAEGYQIAIVTSDPKRISIYEQNFMQLDHEIPDLPCTMRATSHAASMLAGIMFGIFTNYCANKQMNLEYRDVPMFYEFDIPMMNSTILFPDDYEIESPAVTESKIEPEELRKFVLVATDSNDESSYSLNPVDRHSEPF